MFKNLFKKSAPPAPKESIMSSLTSAYRSDAKPVEAPKKKGPMRPYRFPAIGYAALAFLSVCMAGVTEDVLDIFVPEAKNTPIAAALAFGLLAVFCSYNAVRKWKH